MADTCDEKNPTLLIAMSDQQYILRLSLDGKKLAQFDMPGGNPRQIRLHDGRFYVAHLGDNWPKDKDLPRRQPCPADPTAGPAVRIRIAPRGTAASTFTVSFNHSPKRLKATQIPCGNQRFADIVSTPN